MKQLIENVVQWGKDRGLDKVGHLAQAKYTLKETAELLDAYADGDIDKINDAIGDILVTLIVGASNSNNILEDFKESLKKGALVNFNDDFFLTEYISLLDSENHLIQGIENCDIESILYEDCAFSLFSMMLTINEKFNQSLSLKDCLQLAYDEIKNRTGKLVDGQFIKD